MRILELPRNPERNTYEVNPLAFLRLEKFCEFYSFYRPGGMVSSSGNNFGRELPDSELRPGAASVVDDEYCGTDFRRG